jgi:hypothetical protein
MTDEWIKKMCYRYTMEFYSGIKKNVVMLFSGKWMELENFMLSKISQAQKKIKDHMFSLICGSQTYKLNVYIETYMIMHTYRVQNCIRQSTLGNYGRWKR